MADKWLPPLKVPLEKSDPGHYRYQIKKNVDEILDMIKSRSIERERRRNGALKNYNRLFKKFRRYIPVRKKKIHFYAIMNPDKTPIRAVKTKKEALMLLKKEEIDYKLFDYWHRPAPNSGLSRRNQVPPGSIVVRIPALGYRRNIDQSTYVGTEHPNFYHQIVAQKKCPTCPRLKDSSALRCGCSLIQYLKDGTDGYMFYSNHQILMKKHKDRKNPKKVIELSLDDIF